MSETNISIDFATLSMVILFLFCYGDPDLLDRVNQYIHTKEQVTNCPVIDMDEFTTRKDNGGI